MKISAYLAHLTQPGVTELVLKCGERPMALVGGEPIPFGNDPLTEDGLVSALFALGGSRYIDTLAKSPASWTARAEPVGTVSISAKKVATVLEIRLSLLRAAKRADDEPASSSPREVPQAKPAAKPAQAAPPQGPFGAHVKPREEREPLSSSRAEPRSSVRTEPREVRRDPRLESDPPPGETSFYQRREPKSEPQPLPLEPAKEPKSEPQPIPPATVAEARAPSPRVQMPPLHEPTRARDERPHVRIDPMPEPRVEPRPAQRPADVVQEPTMRSEGGPPRPPELEALLRTAIELHASDLHLVSGRPALYRVAFDLVPRGEPLPDALVDKIVLSCVPARQRLALEADGSVDFALDEPSSGRFRVNVSKQRTGFKVSLRVVPRVVPTLTSLGLPQAIAQATHHHQGLIVVTGPTGHGKTTTLAAIVDLINEGRAHHVITVEDPIEFVHPRKKAVMSQREVGTDTQSFLAALKGSLREDPDVIVVGELRDVETVRMAVSASETGHLVLGTMNTPNAAKAIERLIDLFPPTDQAQIRMTLAGGLRLVVGQRLVPSVDKKSLHAAVELLTGSTSLWALIRDNRTFQIPSLQQRGKALGIVRLDESLAELVRDGKVSLEVAKEVAEAPAELEALFAQKPVEQKKPEGLLGTLFGRKG